LRDYKFSSNNYDAPPATLVGWAGGIRERDTSSPYLTLGDGAFGASTHWPGGSNYENSVPMVVKDADDDNGDGDVDEQQQRVGVIGAIGDGEGATIDVSILPRLRH